jgi:hypothetical protein
MLDKEPWLLDIAETGNTNKADVINIQAGRFT